MNQRSKGTTRSIFYRGISLQDYFRNTPHPETNLAHRYGETNHPQNAKIHPQIETDFVLSTPEFVPATDSIIRKRPQCLGAVGTARKSLQLPCMGVGKQMRSESKGHLAERNSTDTSLGSALEQRIGLLPAIQKKVVIRERNITMGSREESSEPSCRKKIVEMRRAAQELFEQPFSLSTTMPESRKDGQQSRKEKGERERRNIRGNIKSNCSNSEYFERAQSYIQ